MKKQMSVTELTINSIIEVIIDDIRARQGIGAEWNNIPFDVKEEIRSAWEKKISIVLHGTSTKKTQGDEVSVMRKAMCEFFDKYERPVGKVGRKHPAKNKNSV